MKNRTKLILALAVGFGLLQLFTPEKIKSATAKNLTGVPEDVNNVLRNSCFDCHSAEARLRWFDKFTPANFLVASHVRDGRAVLNFEKWDSLAAPQQNAILYYAFNKVLAGEMPVKSYTLLHLAAKLDESEVMVLKNYLLTIAPKKVPDSAQVVAAAKQYSQWIKGEFTVNAVKPSLNNIEYIPGYRNWKAISTTDRFDNGTMRIIFANDIAWKAIRSGQTRRWPDGSILAKAAWKQQVNGDGSITAGQFLQVEFMIKDEEKYSASEGWGWARWKGEDLKPYGQSIGFDKECISCHRPVKEDDFVFTRPVDMSDFFHRRIQDDPASMNVPRELPENPLVLIPLTSSLRPAGNTMSTLYGNEAAASYARYNGDGQYPAGALLYEVTWEQQADPVWFGANVPRKIVSVERIIFGPSAEPEYALYQGNPLKKTATENLHQRITEIASQHMAVSP